MTDYKQLCAELVKAWDDEDADWLRISEDGNTATLFGTPIENLVNRVRAALAEPEPEKPTDEELLEAVKAGVASFPPRHPEALNLSAVEYEVELEIRKARAVLARWGK